MSPARLRGSILAIGACLTALQAGARPAQAAPLDRRYPISSAWTIGPTRMTFAGSGWVFEQGPGTTAWKSTGCAGGRVSAVVVRKGPGDWETHAFTRGSADDRPAHCVRRQDGVWSSAAIPFPSGVSLGSDVVAASNVYVAGALEEQSSTPQIAAYFIDSLGNLYASRFVNGQTWLVWESLGKPPGLNLAGPNLAVSSSFNNGAFQTSVWMVTTSGTLVENTGPFDAGQAGRQWNVFQPGPSGPSSLLTPQLPAAVTWYDTGTARIPSNAHTRVMVSDVANGELWALYREPGGAVNWDRLNARPRTAPWNVSASVFLDACAGCPNPVPPTTKSITVISGSSGPRFNPTLQGLQYLTKDNKNLNPNADDNDSWLALPQSPVSLQPPTRLSTEAGVTGLGVGPVYSIDVDGHLYELVTNTVTWQSAWVDRFYPQAASRELIAATGSDGNLQVLGLSGTGEALLAAWQDRNSGGWGNGGLLPRFDSDPRYSSLAVGTGSDGVLHVFGLNVLNGTASVAGTQSPSGAWQGPFALPNAAAFSSLAPMRSTTGQLQLLGVGRANGHVYTVAWRDGGGTWHAGLELPNQTTFFQEIAVRAGNSGNVQVIGLGLDGKAYLAGWQDGGGVWHPGFLLPGQTVVLKAIRTINGNGGRLQVIGLGTDGFAYLAAWQDEFGGWHSGFVLPGQPAQLKSITVANGNLGQVQVLGAGYADSLTYLASWQDGNGGWHSGMALPRSPGEEIPVFSVAAGPGSGGTLQLIALHQYFRPFDGNMLRVVDWLDPSGFWHVGGALQYSGFRFE
jgi:hypothetical protein